MKAISEHGKLSPDVTKVVGGWPAASVYCNLIDRKVVLLKAADDFVFCKIMQMNPDLCREPVELILGRKVSLALTMETQKPIEITADAKAAKKAIKKAWKKVVSRRRWK